MRSDARPGPNFVPLGVLAALAVAAGGLLGFVTLAGEVIEGETGAFDEAVLVFFRNPADLADPIGPHGLELMMRDLTSLGSVTVLALVTLAVLGFLILEGKRAAALLVFVAVVGGTILSQALKLGFSRPRPELVAHLVDVSTMSFPSGHAMLSATTYLTLGALLARVQAGRMTKIYFISIAVLVTLLVGLSRIYLGVHWPTDVLAGWCAGAAWAMLCWLTAYWLQRRGAVESAGDNP